MTWSPLPDSDALALDRLAGQNPACGFMQSTPWADFKRDEGFQIVRLGLYDEQDLVGGATLQFIESEETGAVIVCPEGPVIDWQDETKARTTMRAFVDYIQANTSALVLRIEPHLEAPKPSLLRNWSKAPVDLTPPATLTLDIAQTDEQILAQMKPKGRYNLGVAQRHDVRVRASQDLGAVRDFYHLFETTARRNDFFFEPLGFFLSLAQNLYKADAGEILFAEHGDDILAAIFVLYFGRRATYLYGGSAAKKRATMPNYLLHWHAIHRARERGCTEYDFYGVDAFNRPDHLYAGITKFKLQWGGQVQQRTGALDLVFYDRLAARMVERLSE